MYTRLHRFLVTAGFLIGIFLVSKTSIAQDSFDATVVGVEQGDRLRLQSGADAASYSLFGVICEPIKSPAGQQAKRYVERLAIDQSIRATVRGSIGGAQQIEVVLGDGRVLNHDLLSTGLARLDRVQAAEDEEYRALELDARVAQIGIWRQGQANDKIIAEEPSEEPVEELSALERYKRTLKIQELAEYELALYRWARLNDADRERARLIALRDQDVAERNARERTNESETYLTELDAEMERLVNERARAETTLSELDTQEQNALDNLYDNDPELRARRMRYEEVTAGLELATEQYGPESAQYYFYLEEVQIQEVLVNREYDRLEDRARGLRNQYADQRAGLVEQIERLDDEIADLDSELARAENNYERTLRSANRQAGTHADEYLLVNRLDASLENSYLPQLNRESVFTLEGVGDATTTAIELGTDVWSVNLFTFDYRREGPEVLALAQDTGAPAAKIRARKAEFQRFVVGKDAGVYVLKISAAPDQRWRVEAETITAPRELFAEPE